KLEYEGFVQLYNKFLKNAKSYPVPLIFHHVLQEHNAQLRGEARNDQAAAWHFNTKTTAYQKCHAC
ncbi:hypothetical protein, partial [Vibrio alginolyticus]|uniref:hypothetical protein n=1 Tax=Vibrio alginolyticus TaxID=663 RepID=UPI003D64F1F9